METVYIIVPVYNAQKHLKSCIRSLQKQTYADIRIILVDDGSKDSSPAICDAFAASDSRISVIHKKNGGVMSARYAGIKAVSDSGFTTFCDADDIMPENGVEKLVGLQNKEDVDIVCASLQRFTAGHFFLKQNLTNIYRTERNYTKGEIRTAIIPSFFGIADYPGYMPSKLYRNTTLKKSLEFETPVKFFQEDIAFNLQIALIADSITVSPEIVYYYRTGGGTSRFMPDFLDDCIALYRYKQRMITKWNLNRHLEETSAIELKNECWTWLQMYYEKNCKVQSKDQIIHEIDRCYNLDKIVEAVKKINNDQSGYPGFGSALKNKESEQIYNSLVNDYKKNKIKRRIRNILFQI